MEKIRGFLGAHHYTDSAVKTAAAAANAVNTCLEDGNSKNNIYSNVGSAIKAVSLSQTISNTGKFNNL